MAYQCPRCGGAVERGSSAAAGVAGGLVGALLYAAFGGFKCIQCGPVPKHEFPPEVQSQMTRGTIMMVGGAVVIFIVAIVVIVLIQNL